MEIKDLLNRIKGNDIFQLEKSATISQLAEVFHHDVLYMQEDRLFTILFNRIPNYIVERNIDCRKARAWLEENYISEIKDFYFCRIPHRLKIENAIYFLDEDLMISFGEYNHIRLLFKKTEFEKVEQIFNQICKFKIREEKESKISIIVNSHSGFSTESLKITRPKLSIADNYNDDFTEIHQTILKRLRKKNDKGLVLLHGKPGTGKTSYIRYLVSLVKKKIIFLPPNMASAITNPNLIKLLIDNPHSIFVIEDAENIIIDREHNGSSPVSTLLNISDGLLSDCLNVQIICSFNTDLSKVDTALMRKGRLIAKYEFKEMETQKAQILSDKLGFKTKINSPMTLTDIYNQNENSFQSKSRKAIGF